MDEPLEDLANILHYLIQIGFAIPEMSTLQQDFQHNLSQYF